MLNSANEVLDEIRERLQKTFATNMAAAKKRGKTLADKEDAKSVKVSKEISAPGDPVKAMVKAKAEDDDDMEEALDELDAYLASSARLFAQESGISEDEALEFAFALAEAGTEAGILPELPDLDASKEAVAKWLDSANSSGFGLQGVIALAEGNRK